MIKDIEFKYCLECGKKLCLEDKFCINCGVKQPALQETSEEIQEEKAVNKDKKELNNDEMVGVYNSIRELNLVNFEKKNRNKMLLGSLLGLFLILVPTLFEIHNMKGGYAISILGVLIMLSCLISAIIINSSRVKALEDILEAREILVYWKYSQREWNKFAKDRYDTAKESNKGMLIFMIIIISIVFIPFIIFSKENSIMMVIYIVIIAMLTLAAFLSTGYYKNAPKDGFVIITRKGILMNKEFHCWTGFGGYLKEVNYCAEDSSMIEINYNIAYYRKTHGIGTVIVPIPKGQEKAAERVIEQLNYIAFK